MVTLGIVEVIIVILYGIFVRVQAHNNADLNK
jgi:hypothetical protein